MEELILGFAKQVPALAVLSYIVIKFLSHLEQRDIRSKQMAESCHVIQQEGHRVMQQCAKAMGEVSAYLKKLNGG